MNLQFDHFSEFHEFMTWAGYVKRDSTAVTVEMRVDPAAMTKAVHDAATALATEQHSDIDVPGAESAPDAATQPVPTDKPARRRRTKAEMEAARAAEVGETPAANAAAAQPDGSATTTAGTAESQSTPGAGNPFAQPDTPSQPSAATSDMDLADFLAARMKERPELAAVEHLNLARAFIGKHGIARYNESFPLVNLSANVMSFSPADCAKHAAVLEYLGSE